MGGLALDRAFNKFIRRSADLAANSAGSLFLVLLNLLYLAYTRTLSFSEWLSTVRQDFFSKVTGPSPVQADHVKTLVAPFKKIPRHCSIVVGTDPVSYSDFCKIIVWSHAAGIDHISFYDHLNGIDSLELFDRLCHYSKNIIHKIKWGKNISEKVKESSVKKINGYTWKPEITLHLYKKEDGLQGLVDVVNELHVAGARQVSQADLGAVLNKRIQAPDPDLVIICGKMFSTFAFLPWHLRITHLVHLDSHHNITCSKFLSLLRSYSSCEQRYGK